LLQSLPKILLVDSNSDFSYTVSLTLDAAGYHLLTANDGQEALDILQTETVHLILSEVTLPDMNGYQLHQQIRSNANWANIPFILLTANSDIKHPTHVVDTYLNKPFRVADLIAAVRQYMTPVISLT